MAPCLPCLFTRVSKNPNCRWPMGSLHWILFFLIPLDTFGSSVKVRRVLVEQDQIVSVKTALGIATIIQVPDRPNSLVVGDTEAFKVEYLDQAITIKPLHGGVKSNLYIYTDYRRFNVQLVTGLEAEADYVVYLDVMREKEKSKETKTSLMWTPFRGSLKNESISLKVNRLGRTKDGILLVEFKVIGDRKEEIDPKWIWLTQDGFTKPIHRLIFSRLDIAPKIEAEGLIQILKSDLKDNVPIRFEFRRKQTSFLTLPEVKTWK